MNLNQPSGEQQNSTPEQAQNVSETRPYWKSKTFYTALVALALITIMSIVALTSNKNEATPQVTNSPTQTPEKPSDRIKDNSDGKLAYLVRETDNTYTLVNLESNVRENIIPGGYEIISPYLTEPTSKYLLAEKDNEIFSYNIADKTIKAVLAPNSQPLMNSNEQAHIDSSATEPNWFFIEITEYDPNEYNDFFGGPITPIKTRTYTLNAATGTLTSISNQPLYRAMNGCYKYDSKNQRLFHWKCGEGIGSSLPLSTKNLTGGNEKILISPTDFGLKADDIGPISVSYAGGSFSILSKGGIDKIIIVDAEDTSKQTYTIEGQLKNQLSEDTYPYSAVIVKQENTIIIGGGHDITLLRFNQKNEITDVKILPEPEVYANSMYIHENKLFYTVDKTKQLKSIDLKTWERDSVFSIGSGIFISLFSL